MSVVREGILEKRGNTGLQLWAKRYFVLEGNNLFYWDDKNAREKRKDPGVIELLSCKVLSSDSSSKRPNAIAIESKSKTYHIDFATSADKIAWLGDIQRISAPHTVPQPAPIAATYQSGVHNALQLVLRCEKLTAKDGVGKKSDPYLTITAGGKLLHKTEVVPQNLNPAFSPFVINVPDAGGFAALVTIECIDWDEDGNHDRIGSATCELGDFLTKKQIELMEKTSKRGGYLIIESCVGAVVPPPPPAYTFQFSAIGLDKKDGVLGKSDPIFIITYLGSVVVYKSEIIQKTLNPSWESFAIDKREFIGPNNPALTLSVYDHDDDGVLELIGVAPNLTYQELIFAHQYPLIHPSKKGRGGYKNSGVLYTTVAQPCAALDHMYTPEPAVLQVKCSGSKLAKMDGPLGKSGMYSQDPFFRVALKTTVVIGPGVTEEMYITIARSAVEKKTLNPDWAPVDIPIKQFNITEHTALLIEVFDWDPTGEVEYMGQFNFTLRELKHKSAKFAIVDSSKLGATYRSSGQFSFDSVTPSGAEATVTAHVAPAYKYWVSSSKLARTDGLLTKNDPFFTVRAIPTGSSKPVTVYRSEVLQKCDKPVWAPFILTADQTGGFFTPFMVSVYDWDKDGSHDLIGVFWSTMWEMSVFGPFTYSLKLKSSKSRGRFVVDKYEQVPVSGLPVVPLAYDFKVHADKIAKMDSGIGATADPYFEVWGRPLPGAPCIAYKGNVPPPTTPIMLYRSEFVKQNLSPSWVNFHLNLADVGGFDTEFEVRVYDYDEGDEHDLVGTLVTTLREFTLPQYSAALKHSNHSGSRGAIIVDGVTPLNEVTGLGPLPAAFRIKSKLAKLTKMDTALTGGSSDPFFKINDMKTRKALYRSEVKPKSLNAEYAEFELSTELIGDWDTPIEITVFDHDKDGTHDLIGSFTVTLRDMVAFSWFEGALKHPAKSGRRGSWILQHAVPLAYSQTHILPAGYIVHCSADKLVRMDGPLSKSDPYLEVYVTPQTAGPYWEAGKPIILYRSEVVKKSLKPRWLPFLLDLQIIGSVDQPIEFRVLDFDPNAGDDLIGSLWTNLREWSFGPCEEAITSNGKSRGCLAIDEIHPVGSVPPLILPPAIKISAGARKLDKMDPGIGKKADPFVLIRGTSRELRREITFHRTNVVKQSLNPEFDDFVLDVTQIGGLDAPFAVECWDWDNNGGHDLVGRVTCTLRQWLVGWYHAPLINPEKRNQANYESSGAFVIHEIIPMPPQAKLVAPIAIKVEASAQKLDAKDSGITGKSDPFFEVVAQPAGFSKPIKLYRSETIYKNLNPKWREFVLNSDDLRGLDTPFEIRVYDEDKDGGHDLIGSLKTTLRDWSFGSYQQALLNPEKVNRPGYQSSGAFSVDFASPLFEEYRQEIAVAYEIQLGAQQLEKKDLLGKSDPYFTLTATLPGTSKPVTLHRSEVIKQVTETTWKPFILNVADIKGLDNQFTISVFDWNKDGSGTLIGSVSTDFRELTFGRYLQKLIDPTAMNVGKSRGAIRLDWINPLPASKWVGVYPAYLLQPVGSSLSMELTQANRSFFEVKCTPPGFAHSITVHRSSIIADTKNPTWEPFELSTAMVGGFDNPIEITTYQYHSDGDHHTIGTTQSTLRDLSFGEIFLPLQKNGGSAQGAFVITECTPLSAEQIRPPAPAFEFQLSGKNIARVDLTSQSDCFVTIKTKNTKGEDVIIYRSEVVRDSKNPVWTPFRLNARDFGGLDTLFSVSVMDSDPNGAQTPIGYFHTTLREWALGPMVMPLFAYEESKQSRGGLRLDSATPLDAEHISFLPSNVLLTAAAYRLERMDGLGKKSDPLFEIRTVGASPLSAVPITLYRSEYIKQDLNPKWRPFYLSTDMLGDHDTPFQVNVYDFDSDGNELIGSCTATLREWLMSVSLPLPLVRGSSNASRGGFAIEKVEHVARGQLPAVPPGYIFTVRGTKLDSKNFGIGAKSDPYFELLVPHPSKPGETLTMYRSEHIHDTLEPCWKQFALNVIDVGGLDTPFSIRVFDFEKDGAHQEIGRVEGITLREWTFGPHRHRLKNPDAIRANASCGAFCIDDVQPLAGEVVRAPAPAYIVKPSAAKLERMDDLGTGKSDPFFRIIATPTGFTQPVTVYRSEVIASNLNPSWRPFTLNLCDIGGIDAPIHIMVYDYDSNGPELIGEARTTLRNWTFGPYSIKLTNPDTIRAKKSRGAFSAEITPTDYDPLAKVAPAFHFSVAGQKLDNHDGPGNVSDPFFEIILQRPGQGMPITYYRSETIRDSLNPTWKDFVVNTREIGGFDAPFELLVWDEDRDGAHDLIGRTTLTLRELSFGPYVESLINPERTSRIGYRSSGGFAFNKVVPLAAEQIKVIPSAFALDTSGIKLDVKDANLKSDPYWVLMRVWPPNSGNWVTVYRSDVVQKNTSPSWKPMSISADHVGGVDTPFAIRVYDWNADGLSDFIGEVSGITLRDFSHGNRLVMPILNPAKAAMLRYRSSGGFVFEPKPIDAAKVPIVPENISVEFTGSDLDFKDLNLKSDSFIEVKARTATPKGDKWFTIHRSPMQPKTRNPKWPAFGISAALVGGIDSIFKILVWDFDSDGGHDLIGVTETTIRYLSLGPFVLPITHPVKKSRAGYRSSGALNLTNVSSIPFASLPAVPPAMNLTFSGRKLDRKDSIQHGNKADPFFEIRRIFAGTEETALIYRSEVCNQTLTPTWQPVCLSLQQFGDADTPFLVRVMDSDKQDGVHDLIGQFTTTLREWMFSTPYAHALIHPSKSGRVGYESSGGFYIDVVQPLPDFPVAPPPAYVSLSIAIDNWDNTYESPFLEVWGLSNSTGPTLVHRSEYLERSSSASVFKTFTIDVAAVGGLDSLLAIKVNYLSEAKGKAAFVGGSFSTLREFLASRDPTVIAQIDPKKKKRQRTKYTSSATLTVAVVPVDQTHLPVLRVATAYAITVSLFDPKKPPGGWYIYARRVGGPNVDIFREYGKSTIDLIVPFEAVGSLDGGLEFNHRCGKVFVSLRELAFSANQFYLRKDKAGRKKPFKRRHAGLLQIVDVKPLVQHITSWNLALEFEQLDWKSATSVIPNPFLQILAPLPQGSLSPYELLYLSEAAQQTTDVALAPFAINVARAGGMDSDLLVRALSRDGAAASLIGEYTMTLRSMVFGRYGFLVHPIKRNTITNYSGSGRVRVKEANPNIDVVHAPHSLELLQSL